MKKRRIAITAVLLSAASSSLAAEYDALCPPLPTFNPPATASQLPQGSYRGEADSLETLQDGRVLLSGNVEIEDPQRRLQADRAQIDRQRGRVEFDGALVLENEQMRIEADSGSLNQGSGEGEFRGAHYQLNETRGNGYADAILTPKPNVTLLDGAMYTTCEPEDPEWALYMSRLYLDRNEGMGTAHNMRLHLWGVPVFYWPWMTFPITDDRKSGLLFPSFAHSDDGGFEYAQPIYWNIAPQADATITPRYIENRGTQASVEARYLNGWGSFEANGSQLDDRLYGDDRWLTAFKHNGKIGAGWSSYLDTKRVSDSDFFGDLDTGLPFGDEPVHLLSQGGVRYSGAIWRHQIGVQRYQTVDDTIAAINRPYSKEPFVRSTAVYDFEQYELNLQAETVDFGHNQKVQGQRLDLYPSIARTFGTPGWYVRPKAGVRHTAYQLDQLSTTTEEAPSRNTAIASLDTGLVLERETSGGLIHTLEPRLYGLYAERQDQSDIPLFDTGAYTFSYDQLFRENRFTGADRQADAQQVTAGVTTRWLGSNYEERVSASIGRIYYLDDREVTLDESAPAETGEASDIAAMLRAQLTQRWRADANWQYSRDSEQLVSHNYQLRYKDPARRILNLGYREVEAGVQTPTSAARQQAEVAAALPLGSHWEWFGRYFYDLIDERPLETFAGFSYQSCCWAASFIARRQLDLDPASPTVEDYDTDYLLQFTFRGLGSVGDDNERALDRGILGYAEER